MVIPYILTLSFSVPSNTRDNFYLYQFIDYLSGTPFPFRISGDSFGQVLWSIVTLKFEIYFLEFRKHSISYVIGFYGFIFIFIL